MKRNRTAAILVIILGSLTFWFVINNKKGTIKETLKDFAVADTASITKIFLADKEGNSLTLERAQNNPQQWIINQKYEVRRDAILNLLTTIKKVDVKAPVGKNAENNIIKRLAAKAIRCEIFQNNKLSKAYYVGTETPDQTGTYMILMDPETMQPSAKPFVTCIPGFEGYLTTRYFTNEKEWRDRTVLHYSPNNIKSVKFEAPFNPENNYELKVNSPNSFEIVLNNKKSLSDLDTFAVKQYLSYFQQLNFESFETFLKSNSIDSVLKSKPINIITVTDNTGKSNSVKFFSRKPNAQQGLDENGKPYEFDPIRMDAYSQNLNDLVIVQYYTFGKILPPSSYFQKKKPTAATKTEKKKATSKK